MLITKNYEEKDDEEAQIRLVGKLFMVSITSVSIIIILVTLFKGLFKGW